MKTIFKKHVLILNKNWIPINTTTARNSFSLMYADNAKGLLIEDDRFLSLEWNEWIKLDIKDKDDFVRTVNGHIKIPNIIVLNYNDKIPKQVIKFTQKNLWERDNYTCQYTGKKLNKNNGNIDHIVPRSQGGKTSWENCVLAHKQINALKADRTPEQAGLKLIKKPKAPRVMPVSFYIRNNQNIKEWDMFLK
jgi:5-methylcytosine-specific restriction endonuclease McrA